MALMLSCIHPRQLLSVLEARVPTLYQRISDRLAAAFATSQDALRTREEVVTLMHHQLTHEETQHLKNHLAWDTCESGIQQSPQSSRS